jgi:hypothetical protein
VQEPFDAEAYLEATTFGVSDALSRGSRREYTAFSKAVMLLAVTPLTLFSAADHEVAAASEKALTALATGVGTGTVTERGTGTWTTCSVNTAGENVNRAIFKNELCTLVSRCEACGYGCMAEALL